MLAQVNEAAEAAGYRVQAVASYGKQIEALRELNMEARTATSVLEARQKNRFKLDEKTVLVIDEAGMVLARIMERLMKMAEADGARVVMLGDTGQTKAIEAGPPLHQLQAAGNASASLAVMDGKLKAAHSIDDNGARHDAVASKYATRRSKRMFAGSAIAG